MNGPSDATRAARRRRAEGTIDSFSGVRLSIARRLAVMAKTELADKVHVTPSAITQLERGEFRPTTVVASRLALALGVPVDFFAASTASQPIPASAAHFRSVRSTPANRREQALAFAELSLELCTAIEDWVDLPRVDLPELGEHNLQTTDGATAAAAAARAALDVAPGPVPHVVRLLEARGVLVLTLPEHLLDRRVDAFSTSAGHRPLVLLSPMKDDKARSRFDAAHELGHLLLHHDVEPGSRIVESQAQNFAAAFLAPPEQIVDDLPRRVNWETLLRAKRKWGISLRALIYRSHTLGLITDSAFRRANIQLSKWGNPERGPIGPPESPGMLGRATDLLIHAGTSIDALADHAGMPAAHTQQLVASATDARPIVG